MDIFNYIFFQNALLGVIIVSVASAIIGTYIVTRRMVFITGGITHACFGGLGLGYYLGMNPIIMASVFAISSALGVEYISTRQRVREDSAIAVVWAFGMAIGTMFIFLSPGYVPELNSFLFGNILMITYNDLFVFLSFTTLLILFFIFFYNRIIACAFDRDFARTMRLPERIINYTMTIFIAVGIVLTIRLMGIMLLMSLMTLPQMISEVFCNRFKSMMLLSIVVSIFSSVAGLFAAYLIDVPASATIVMMLILIYAITRIYKNITHKRKFAQLNCNNRNK